jgi:hypothetical protein
MRRGIRNDTYVESALETYHWMVWGWMRVGGVSVFSCLGRIVTEIVPRVILRKLALGGLYTLRIPLHTYLFAISHRLPKRTLLVTYRTQCLPQDAEAAHSRSPAAKCSRSTPEPKMRRICPMRPRSALTPLPDRR